MATKRFILFSKQVENLVESWVNQQSALWSRDWCINPVKLSVEHVSNIEDVNSDINTMEEIEFYSLDGAKMLLCPGDVDWHATLFSGSDVDVPEDEISQKIINSAKLNLLDRVVGRDGAVSVDVGDEDVHVNYTGHPLVKIVMSIHGSLISIVLPLSSCEYITVNSVDLSSLDTAPRDQAVLSERVEGKLCFDIPNTDIADLGRLRVGDVLFSNHKSSDPLYFKIKNSVVCRALLGKKNENKAIYIVEK